VHVSNSETFNSINQLAREIAGTSRDAMPQLCMVS